MVAIFPLINKINRISERVNLRVAHFNGIVVLVAVTLVAADVTGRYLFNRPIVGAAEIIMVLLPAMFFLGYAHGLIIKQHVRMGILLDRFPERVRLVVEVIAGLAGAVLFAVLLLGGWAQFWASFVVREIMPAAIPFPFWLPKLVLPVAALLMFIQCLLYMLSHLESLLRERGEK